MALAFSPQWKLVQRDDAYVEMMALQTKTFTNMERDDQDFAYHVNDNVKVYQIII